MRWSRKIAALGAAAALAVPLAAGALPAGGRRTSGSFSVGAVVVRSVPVALRGAPAAAERALAPSPAQDRRIAVPGARAAAGAPAGAPTSTVVFVDGEPPSWKLLDRPAHAAARAEPGPVLARR